jgi:N-acetylglutamate synthase-like GNAT family acetyltransferase
MYTSYEDRLSLLQQFHQGAEAFQVKIPEGVIKKGDGWKLASIGSSFGMFNTALIYSGRKDLVAELMDAIKELNIPVDIRLVGPGLTQTGALTEHGYKNFGAAPLMIWSADDTVDSFTLRPELSVRRLTESDLETMCVIYKDVYSMSDEMVHDMKKMLLASPNDYTYGLFKDNEMVSLVTAMVFNDTIGIWSMGTPTAHQKNGYGQQLLMQVMKTHKEMGAKNFFLHATVAGKFLYDKAGWMTLDYLPYFSKPKTQ